MRETARKSDVVMIQVPSGAVAKWAEIVLAEGSRIIDIGADIRFRDVKVWEKWYGDKHTNPQMTHDAVYSMPEMNRELAKGKKLYDKRETAARKDAKREMDRAMKSRNSRY